MCPQNSLYKSRLTFFLKNYTCFHFKCFLFLSSWLSCYLSRGVFSALLFSALVSLSLPLLDRWCVWKLLGVMLLNQRKCI